MCDKEIVYHATREKIVYYAIKEKKFILLALLGRQTLHSQNKCFYRIAIKSTLCPASKKKEVYFASVKFNALTKRGQQSHE